MSGFSSVARLFGLLASLVDLGPPPPKILGTPLRTVTAWNRLEPRITLIESKLQCKLALKEFTNRVALFH